MHAFIRDMVNIPLWWEKKVFIERYRREKEA